MKILINILLIALLVSCSKNESAVMTTEIKTETKSEKLKEVRQALCYGVEQEVACFKNILSKRNALTFKDDVLECNKETRKNADRVNKILQTLILSQFDFNNFTSAPKKITEDYETANEKCIENPTSIESIFQCLENAANDYSQAYEEQVCSTQQITKPGNA